MVKIPLYEFVTGRLRLSAAEPARAETLFRNYTGSEKASIYLQRKPHRSVADTQTMLEVWGRQSWNAGGRFAWVMSNGNGGEATGLVLLIASDRHAEIHFGIAPHLWGRGLATEAVQAVMGWIAASSDIDDVTTVCDREHVASASVLSKSGFTRLDSIKDHLFLPHFGADRDCLHFAWKRKNEDI